MGRRKKILQAPRAPYKKMQMSVRTPEMGKRAGIGPALWEAGRAESCTRACLLHSHLFMSGQVDTGASIHLQPYDGTSAGVGRMGCPMWPGQGAGVEVGPSLSFLGWGQTRK